MVRGWSRDHIVLRGLAVRPRQTSGNVCHRSAMLLAVRRPVGLAVLAQVRWAGHNKWSKIFRDKAVNDQARNLRFTKCALEIISAVKGAPRRPSRARGRTQMNVRGMCFSQGTRSVAEPSTRNGARERQSRQYAKGQHRLGLGQGALALALGRPVRSSPSRRHLGARQEPSGHGGDRFRGSWPWRRGPCHRNADRQANADGPEPARHPQAPRVRPRPRAFLAAGAYAHWA